ncbi:hypothetical protein FACS1894113_1600 [Alphaproteobacteria bacterium]|nr:hypothetical protein FACS1894113_1600 [Alphaproteobacteria bacterium]
MNFLKKTILFAVFITGFILLHSYFKELGIIELTVMNHRISVGLYATFAFLIFIFLILYILKYFLSLISKFFSKENNLVESVQNIAELILQNDKDFMQNINKFYISEELEIIKKALMLQRDCCSCKDLDLTGFKILDTRILKLKLNDFLEKNDIVRAISLGQKLISKHAKYLPIVQNELIKVATIARKNNIKFIFNPRKFKYNLSKNFADKYLFDIEILSLENIKEKNLKLKFLEKIVKKFNEINDSYDAILKFIKENNINEYDEKYIIKFIKNSFEILPNRNLIYYLLDLNKANQFEIAQEITANISNDNIEKLWFLLIVALSAGFCLKCQEIIEKLNKIVDKKELLEFFYKSKPEYIINLKLTENDNKIL